MIYLVAVLVVILFILIGIIIKRERDFAHVINVNSQMNRETVSRLAVSMRDPKIDGSMPKVRYLKRRMFRAYKVISIKVYKKEELYEYERWIYEHYYAVMTKFTTARYTNFALLPHVFGKARIMYLAEYILNKYRFAPTLNEISAEIGEFQQSTPLDNDEIFALQDALLYVLVENISKLAIDSIKFSRQKNKAYYKRYNYRYANYDCYNYWRSRLGFLESDSKIRTDYDFNNTNVEFSFSKTLFEHNKTISNCINTINIIEENFNLTYIISLCLSDKIMSADEYYRLMDNASKEAYLRAITHISQKYDIKEETVIGRAIELGRKTSEHFGIFLFEKKRLLKNYILKGIMPDNFTVSTRGLQNLLIATVYGSSILISIIVGLFTGYAIWRMVLIGIATFFAVISVAELIAITVFSTFLSRKPVPKLNNSSIDDDNQTLVIMPCYVNDKVEIDHMCDSIIRVREGNSDENISFALLVDYKSSSSPTIASDIDFDKQFKTRLKGYDDINLYVRKRVKIHNKYEGYERKRGAIMALCDMLLTKNTEEFRYILRENGMYTPKYIVTLDSDSELLPNSVLDAVNTMLHPLNQKYTLMTFKNAYNLFSSHSLYARKYYHESGFDKYGTSDSFYHNLTGKAIFNGKGIFKLREFYSALYNVLPSGKVLSHDIIEGALVSTGELAQEVFEDIPNSLRAEMSRKNRWLKGDVMLLPFIKNRIKNDNDVTVTTDKEPIYKFVMLQNVFKAFTPIALFVLLIVGMYYNSILVAIPFIVLFCIPYLLRVLIVLLKGTARVRRRFILRDLVEIIVQALYHFFALPFYALNNLFVMLSAIFDSLVKKTGLKWKTFAVSQNDKSFKSHLVLVLPSMVLSTILSIIFIPNLWLTGYFAISVAVMLCIYVTTSNNDNRTLIKDVDAKYLKQIAAKTYKYFCDSEINDLVCDNYQVKPYKGKSKHTSPSNIGFSLLAEISAYHLDIIDLERVERRLIDKINAIKSLRKYKGHLYNWYNVESKQILPPNFISSVDSGNFVACLVVVRNFMKKHNLDGVDDVNELINNTDFEFLFDKQKQQFYIGYNTVDKTFTGYYDMLASESRVLYYIYSAISHNTAGWLGLKRASTSRYGNTLLSWSGTMFEYMMPRIFINSPETSLLDTSERNIYRLAYHRKCNDLFGISESGYYKYDNNLNYQYNAFGLSEVSLRNVEDRCVITPYATFIGMDINISKAMANLDILAREDMVGEYGYFEALDLTGQKHIIYSYMAHHQGMILASIANVISDNCIREYFMSDSQMSGARQLLTEKRDVIKSIIREKSDFVYDNVYEKDLTSSNLQCGVLTNRKYTIFTDKQGQNVSICNDNIISKFRPYSKRNGLVNYVADKENNRQGYVLDQKLSEAEYEYKTSAYSHEYTNKTNSISQKIYIPHCFAGEIRKFEIQNSSENIINRKCFGYMDISLCSHDENIAHPAFSDMFVSSEQIDKGVIYRRKSRAGKGDKYVGIKMYGLDEIVFESNKRNCIAVNTKEVIWQEKNFDNSFGDVVTPCFSYIGNMTISPYQTGEYFLVILYNENKEELIAQLNALVSVKDYGYLIDSAKVNGLSQINRLIEDEKHFVFTSKCLDNIWHGWYDKDKLDNIAKYDYASLMHRISCSEYCKIITYNYSKSPAIAYKVLNTFKLLRYLPIKTKLVVTVDSRSKRQLNENLLRELESVGAVIMFDNEKIKMYEDIALCNIDSLDISIFKYIVNIERNILKSSSAVPKPKVLFQVKNGGFTNDGYLIDDFTRKPYSNVICMEEGGTVNTCNGCSFSYFGNSRADKFTEWVNDVYEDVSSEILLAQVKDNAWVLNKLYNKGYVLHQKGRSIYRTKNCGLDCECSSYMIKNGKVKIYQIQAVNQTPEEIEVTFSLAVRNVLGVEYKPYFINVTNEQGVIILHNVVNGNKIFVQCSDYPLQNITHNNGVNEMGRKIKILPAQKVVVYFTISNRMDELEDLDRTALVENEEKSLLYFENLNKINISTNNKAFDILFNDLLLLQTVSARLNGKCGYYQVGGAIGFRDQLQDCLAYMYSNPKYVKEHILKCGSRQFIEGDVLHWWHEPNVGVRTGISDDKLFLPYVVSEYIRITGDEEILNIKVPYLVGEQIPDGADDLYKSFETSEVVEDLRSHCVRAIENSLKYGTNDLLLIGSGDWNDALNGIGSKEKGESVWLSMFAYYTIEKFLPYLSENLVKKLQFDLDRLRNGIDIAYKGKWYARAVTKDGEWLGVDDAEVCRIDLICQSFAVICGACSKQKSQNAINNAESLVDYDEGLVKLLAPPFNSRKYYGYISNYPCGVRENGGQYTHSVAWYIKALASMDKDKAMRILSMINPINKSMNNEHYDVEPYVMSADVYLNGTGGWTWYTGSSAWLYKVMLEDIIGVNIDNGVLTISPHYYKELGDKVVVSMQILGKRIDLTLLCNNNKRMTVNGVVDTSLQGYRLKLDKEINEYNIIIEY